MLVPVDRENVHLQFMLDDGMHDFFQFKMKGVRLELLSMTCSAPLSPPPPAVHSPSHAEGQATASPGAELPGTDPSKGVDGGPIRLVAEGPSVGPHGSEKPSEQQGLSAGLVFGIGLCTAVGLYVYHRRNQPHGIWRACASMRQVRIENASDLEMPEASIMPSDAEDDEASNHAAEPPRKPQRDKNLPSLNAASKKLPGRCRKYDDLEEETGEEGYDHVNHSAPSGRNGKPHRAGFSPAS